MHMHILLISCSSQKEAGLKRCQSYNSSFYNLESDSQVGVGEQVDASLHHVFCNLDMKRKLLFLSGTVRVLIRSRRWWRNVWTGEETESKEGSMCFRLVWPCETQEYGSCKSASNLHCNSRKAITPDCSGNLTLCGVGLMISGLNPELQVSGLKMSQKQSLSDHNSALLHLYPCVKHLPQLVPGEATTPVTGLQL